MAQRAEDRKNGFGKYFYQTGERFFGNWQNNLKEGSGVYHYTDGSYYEGIFHNDCKEGSGKLHKPDGTIEEQFHEKSLENTKFMSEEFIKKETDIIEEIKENKPDILINSENKPTLTESMDDKIHFSEFKSDIKTLEIGLETLSLIDQIEMMNSLNANLLKKDRKFKHFSLFYFLIKVQEWTIDDVSEWLTNIGLVDYIDTFKNNHISGKNLLDIKEVELKDDLCVCSVGHRKNFIKSQEHLKKIYSKNRIFNQAIRTKLKNFYEKHKNHLRSNHYLHFNNNNNKFNSIRSSLSNEIIEEDQNDSLKEDYTKMNTANANEITTNVNGLSNETTTLLKKISYDNFIDEETDLLKKPEHEHCVLMKKRSKSPMIEPIENNKNNEDGIKGPSESDTSSDSSSSSDDENPGSVTKKPKKEKKEESTNETKPPNHLHIIIPKKIQKTQKSMQYSSSLDSNLI